MKKARKSISILLALMLLVSALAVPASAATIGTTNWQGVFDDFPQLYSGGPNAGYIKMLQRFLIVNPFSHSSMKNNNQSNPLANSVDGIFGTRTYEAVKAFQSQHAETGKPDGIVGDKTWMAIYGDLSRSGSVFHSTKSVPAGLTSSVVICQQNGYYVDMYTLNESNVQFSAYFRRVS